MSYIRHYKPCLCIILVLIYVGFILNSLYILSIVLIEQFLKNLRRFTKAGNKDLFLTIEF
jgi:hypothetical protein